MAIVVSKRLLDVKEAADYLSISRAGLYRLVKAGKLPSITLGDRRLYDVLDLDEFVNKLKKHCIETAVGQE